MSKLIPLSRGLFATVDDEDFDWLSQWKWVAQPGGRKGSPKFYAIRRDGKRSVLMHREIAGIDAGIGTDHRDGDGLNNQRLNLRPANQSQNLLNAAKRRNAKSRFKGVSAKRQKWEARFMNRRFGVFDTEEAAARAYDNAARDHDPEFALTNFDENGIERSLVRAIPESKPIRWTSRTRGVHFRKREKKWFVKIDGKERGSYATERLAKHALRSMKKEA